MLIVISLNGIVFPSVHIVARLHVSHRFHVCVPDVAILVVSDLVVLNVAVALVCAPQNLHDLERIVERFMVVS